MLVYGSNWNDPLFNKQKSNTKHNARLSEINENTLKQKNVASKRHETSKQAYNLINVSSSW